MSQTLVDWMQRWDHVCKTELKLKMSICWSSACLVKWKAQSSIPSSTKHGWRHTPVIPALTRWRQEAQVYKGYKANSRSAWAPWHPVSKRTGCPISLRQQWRCLFSLCSNGWSCPLSWLMIRLGSAGWQGKTGSTRNSRCSVCVHHTALTATVTLGDKNPFMSPYSWTQPFQEHSSFLCVPTQWPRLFNISNIPVSFTSHQRSSWKIRHFWLEILTT